MHLCVARQIRIFVASAVLAMTWSGCFTARAADLPFEGVQSAPSMTDPGAMWDVRFGVFAHGVTGVEAGTVDLNGSIVSPRLNLFGLTGPWVYLAPRFQLGGSWNLSGRTNVGYFDALWTYPIFKRMFLEGYFGLAIHDGSSVETATQAGLGCDLLFHVGGSVGYRVNESWSVMATYEHLSNGRNAFGRNCGTNVEGGRNQGLNNWGGRIVYSFAP